MNLEIDDMDAQRIAAIDRQEDAINHTIHHWNYTDHSKSEYVPGH